MTGECHYISWEKFVNGGTVGGQAIREVIAQSWSRCRRMGVNHLGGSSSIIATGKELEALLVQNKDLIDASMPFMQNLYKLVESSGFVVVLVDKNGYIIEVIGDIDVLESNRGMHYSRGVKWAENLVGSSEIGRAHV